MNSNQAALAYFKYSRDTLHPRQILDLKQELTNLNWHKKNPDRVLDGYGIDVSSQLRMVSFQRKKKTRAALLWQADSERKVKIAIRLGWWFGL